MKEPHVSVIGKAQAETAKAFCIKDMSYAIDGVGHTTIGDVWIPKANIMEDSLETIEEAERNEEIEIFVAKWWLKEL